MCGTHNDRCEQRQILNCPFQNDFEVGDAYGFDARSISWDTISMMTLLLWRGKGVQSTVEGTDVSLHKHTAPPCVVLYLEECAQGIYYPSSHRKAISVASKRSVLMRFRHYSAVQNLFAWFVCSRVSKLAWIFKRHFKLHFIL